MIKVKMFFLITSAILFINHMGYSDKNNAFVNISAVSFFDFYIRAMTGPGSSVLLDNLTAKLLGHTI